MPLGLGGDFFMNASQNDQTQDGWKLDPKCGLKEGLGFLKDWVTTFLTLQSSIIAAVAAFVSVQKTDEFLNLKPWQMLPLGIAAACSLFSIVSGLYLLNMIPAAAQRVAEPDNKTRDLFSIKTERGGRSIKFKTECFRLGFIAAMAALVVFVVMRLTRVG
jgi:hypothetical protein